jgi:hypothetical protein
LGGTRYPLKPVYNRWLSDTGKNYAIEIDLAERNIVFQRKVDKLYYRSNGNFLEKN